MRIMIAIATVLSFGHACGAATSTDPSSPPPAPPPTTPSDAPSPSGSPSSASRSDDDGCQVSVRTHARPAGDGRFELIVTATNETERPITASLESDCPGPGATFSGLPDGFDVSDRCVQGACAGGALTRSSLAIAPGSSVDVARATFATGATSCHGALPSGAYSIGATIRLADVRTCSSGRAEVRVGQVGQVVGAPPETRRGAPERRDPPPRPAPPERCPPMGCAYTPCPPGVEPPTGCAAVCGCTGMRRSPFLEVEPAPPQPVP